MDYKDTLLMPKTAFEMRGNLVKKEPLILKQWQEENYYQKLLDAHKDDQLFVLHDGPPYANNNLHAGTAMNRVIKDIIVRSKAMNKHLTPFFPGWDTHGLPIENAIEKLGINRKQVSVSEFRLKAQEYALKQVAIQKSTMQRLGQIADYDNPYITLTKGFEARQVKSFAEMAKQGLIYQGLKPIYWSPYQETAIADSEIVYFDRKDPAIFVMFKTKDTKGLFDEANFVIWTTTPWTIPANLAISLHPEFDYSLVQTEKGNLIVLSSKVATLMAKFEISQYQVLNSFKGQQLEGIKVYHPLYDERESIVIVGQHVTDEDGTGCVHTAPGHGVEDFNVCLKYGIKAYCPVDEKGLLTAETGVELAGKFVLDANKDVTQLLDQKGRLLKLEFITHSYPHDERLKKPVIFRATVQWFASISKIREKLLNEIDRVEWLNVWGKHRLYNMIKDRSDWCISRQRLWGVPIPIIYTEDHKPIMEEAVFDHIASLIEKHGSNIWFEREAKDLLPENYTNPASPNNLYTKEKDIMDVWFDSGSSHNELKERGLNVPCDLYFEGSDQYRGWFNSSLIVSVATNNLAPYKAVLSHGYVCDSQGKKMSKSVGNVVNPIDIIEKYGADIFRLWAANSDYRQDMRIGEANLKQVSESYRKIRNTFRFLLGNINPEDFDYRKDLLPYDQLTPSDQYMLIKLSNINQEAKKLYDDYDFLRVSVLLSTFMTNLVSAYYLDYTKDILYIEKQDSLRRRQVQTVIYHLTDTLVRLWAPILPFTAHEIWQNFDRSETLNVQYLNFKDDVIYDNQESLVQDFEQLMAIRTDIFKALEEARSEKIIGKPLEAKVSVNLSVTQKELMEQLLGDECARWLIVSSFEYSDETLTQYSNSQVKVEAVSGHTCPRCWNIYSNIADQELCLRCKNVLK